MILGIGVDIIEIDRIEKAIKKQNKFLEKIFTNKEIEYFQNRKMNIEVIAGNFAAKEAISKALGTGFRGISFLDIEVLRDELGKPLVNIENKIKKNIEYILGDRQAYKIHLTAFTSSSVMVSTSSSMVSFSHSTISSSARILSYSSFSSATFAASVPLRAMTKQRLRK